MGWTIETASEIVDRELSEFDDSMVAKLSRIRAMVELHGPDILRMPLARPLERGLWELRLQGKGKIGRAVYFTFAEKRMIILRGFIKKTEKTPRREIEIAWERARKLMI